MKKYVTIKFEKTDLDHLKKWIENSITLAKYIKPESKNMEWQEKILKNIKKQEDNLPK